MNLDELLPEYAPDLYAKYEETGILDSAKNKGHIVCLPWTMTMNNRHLSSGEVIWPRRQELKLIRIT